MQKSLPSVLTFVLIGSLVFAPLSFAQTLPVPTAPQQKPQPKQEPAAPEEVVRISTRLIQIDAVAVDKDGKQVTDLKAEDFKILEDGKEQTITNFSYISLQPETPKFVKAEPKAAPSKVGEPPVPTAMIKPEEVRRTLALIADDLGLSFESMVFTRNALHKFVDQQMQPGDLVAVIRTSAGSGALQRFTNDKRLLHLAIDRIQFFPNGRTQSAFEPMGGRSSLEAVKATAASSLPYGGGVSVRVDGVMTNGSAEVPYNTLREDISKQGTIGAVRYVVEGLRELPGRKSVLLMSDGLAMFPRVGGAIMGDRSSVDVSSSGIVTALKNLTEMANRASVVIYTMDTRGLQTNGINAIDDTQPTFEGLGASGDSLSSQQAAATATIVNRKNQLTYDNFRLQDGLNYLASQTGGFFIHDNNNLAQGIQKVVDDQRGYYLIGYVPEDSTFNELGRRTFHKLQVVVKNPKLRVRSRTGFFGISDEEIKKPLETREEQIKAALASPFNSSGVEVNMSSMFTGDHEKQLVRTMIHVNARDLTFTKQENGDYLTDVDIAATTHNENGLPIDRGGHSYTLRVKGTDYEVALRDGIMYALDVPIKNPGAYQLRLAVRDEKSQRVGSASQFIEVPDIKKNNLALSGISMNGEYENGGKLEALVQASPALRRMKRGMILSYGFAIYNPKLDPSNRPNLTTQAKLFYEGQQIFSGKEAPLNTPQPSKTKRVFAGGSIDLGANLKPGQYVMQVIVSDMLAKEKSRTSTQWINFEILN
jgi:VWFA-related protein